MDKLGPVIDDCEAQKVLIDHHLDPEPFADFVLSDTAASSTLGPFTVSSGTQKIDTRARARSISLKIDNTSTSQFWKLGTFRIDYQPDGRR